MLVQIPETDFAPNDAEGQRLRGGSVRRRFSKLWSDGDLRRYAVQPCTCVLHHSIKSSAGPLAPVAEDGPAGPAPQRARSTDALNGHSNGHGGPTQSHAHVHGRAGHESTTKANSSPSASPKTAPAAKQGPGPAAARPQHIDTTVRATAATTSSSAHPAPHVQPSTSMYDTVDAPPRLAPGQGSPRGGRGRGAPPARGRGGPPMRGSPGPTRGGLARGGHAPTPPTAGSHADVASNPFGNHSAVQQNPSPARTAPGVPSGHAARGRGAPRGRGGPPGRGRGRGGSAGGAPTVEESFGFD